jgi:hypothetical protein
LHLPQFLDGKPFGRGPVILKRTLLSDLFERAVYRYPRTLSRRLSWA